MVQSTFDHHHNQMATYHGNPLAIGSCWGLEVEMLDRHDEQWKRMSDFPNPGKANELSHRVFTWRTLEKTVNLSAINPYF